MINKKPRLATILYKPTDRTYQRILLAISEGYKFYIFDNHPNDEVKIFVAGHKEEIRYFTFDRNLGVGPALRLMCATAYYENNEHLLYFDQDTIYDKETLRYISDYMANSSSYTDVIRKERIFSVTFRDSATNSRKKTFKIIALGEYDLNIVDFTISSGTLFSLEELRRVGWHHEGYRMDGVDYCLCLDAEKAGYKIAEIFNTPGLDHKKEQNNKEYRILSITFSGHKYPISRILDYGRSSLKLITRSALMGSKKTMRILKLSIVYILSQFLIYISKEK